ARYPDVILEAGLGEDLVQYQGAFIRSFGVQEMDRVEIHDVGLPLAQILSGGLKPRRHRCRVECWRRAGAERLPAAQQPELSVMVEQMMQERRARAGQPH